MTALTWVKIANVKGPKGDAGDTTAMARFDAIEAKNVTQDTALAALPNTYVPLSRGVLADGTDFNTLSGAAHVGAWSIIPGYTYPNGPAIGSTAVLEVQRGSGNTLSVVHRVTAGSLVTWREAVDSAAGTWSAWEQVETKTASAQKLTDAKAYTDTRETATKSYADGLVATDRGRLTTLETNKWLKGDIGSAVDFDTLNTSGFRGILSGSGTNQPAPNVGPLETRTFGTGRIDEFATWETKPRKFIRSNASGTMRPWNEFQMADQALIDWRQAYRYASTVPAQILAVGDSITEGTGTTTLANRWQTVLQSYLRRQQTPGQAGATFPFIPAKYATSAPGQPVTQAGAVTSGFGWGFGWRVARLEDATAEIVFTFTGTSATLMYTKTTLTGVMAIQVDGGAATVVDTNGSTNNAATWSTGALTAGTHTVRVTRDASSAAGQYPYIQGLLTYNGDETKGVRVIDAGKHGISTAQLTQANTDNTAAALKAAGTFAAVIIGLGTNDYSAGTSAITYRDNILRLIASTRATLGGFTGSIVLLNMYMGGSRDNAVWTPYGEQLSVIAAADPKVRYVDLRWDMPDVPSPTTDPAGQGMYSDALHPNDVGHRKIAGVLAKVLAG